MGLGRWRAVALAFLTLTPLMPGSSAEPSPERLIVTFDEIPRSLAPGGTFLGEHVVAVDGALRFAVVEARDGATFRAAAADHEDVVRLEPDLLLRWIESVPNDPRFSQQYGPQQLNAPAAWDSTLGGTQKRVCIVDTGIRRTHEDLAANYVGGYDFVHDDTDPWDDHGHGTHVAGSAAAVINNGKGIAGVGNAPILAVKALNSNGDGYISDVSSAIRWCADNGGDVISMSLGMTSFSQTLADAVVYAYGRDRVLVGAAGNDGPCSNCVNYPAKFAQVMAVSCTTSARDQCYFTSDGPEVDVAGPGYSILSAGHGSDTSYVSMSGTSMSAPHVAGLVALLWNGFPHLAAQQVRDVVYATADDVGQAGRDDLYGHGIPNARRALDEATPELPLERVFYEDFDDGQANTWVTTGLWHVDSACQIAPTAPNYLGYHVNGACHYDTLTRNTGTASFSVDLRGAVQAALIFQDRSEVGQSSAFADVMRIEATKDGGATWTNLRERSSWVVDQDYWAETTIPINGFVGHVTTIRFFFDTRDLFDNVNPGWYVDAVEVVAADNYPPRAAAGVDVTLRDGDASGSEPTILDATASTDADGSILSYEWREGDTVLGTTATVNVALGVGTHTILLNVTDNDGGYDTDTKTVIVLPNAAPVAALGIDCLNLACDLTTRSIDIDGTIASWRWEFGDGATADCTASSCTFAGQGTTRVSATTVRHVYAASGSFAVRLQATDAAGAVGEALDVATVPVRALLQEDFDDGSVAGWTLGGSWHIDSRCGGVPPSAPNYLGWHVDGACTFSSGRTNSGTASFTVDLATATAPALRFDSQWVAGGQVSVRITNLATGQTTTLATLSGDVDQTTWKTFDYDLSTWIGKSIRVRFDLYQDWATGVPEWWLLDDVYVLGASGPIAKAGPDIVATDGNSDGIVDVFLNGTATVATGAPIASWAWRENGELIASTATAMVSLGLGVHNITLTVIDADSFQSSDSVLVTIQPNAPPVARAGPDVTLRDADGDGRMSTILDGTASSDADGSIASYTWLSGLTTIGSGPTPLIELAVGTHDIRLAVSDNAGAISQDHVIVSILPNRAPIARPGPDQTRSDADGTGSETVTLDGRGSYDPDSVVTGYEWVSQGTTLGTTSVISHPFAVGTHSLALRVTDEGGLVGETLVNVTILANAAPSAAAGADALRYDNDATGAEPFSVGGAATDPDGTIVSYAWFLDGQPVAATRVATISVPLGQHTLRFEATDNGGLVGADELVATVRSNQPPTLVAQVSCLSLRCTYNATGSSDPDGDNVTYTWSFGDGSSATGLSTTHTYATNGNYAVVLTGRDAPGLVSTLMRTAEVIVDPLRFAPMVPPHEVTTRDTVLDPMDDGGRLGDVESSWIEVDSERVYIGLKLKQYEPAAASEMSFEVEFVPNWTATDPKWGTTFAPSSILGLRVSRYVPGGAASQLDVVVNLSGRPAYVKRADITSTASSSSDIIWWTIPRTLLQSPPEGVVVSKLTATVYPYHAGVTLPRTALDTTGPGQDHVIRRALRVASGGVTYSFATGDDGFVAPSILAPERGHVAWDAAHEALAITTSSADATDTVAGRDLPKALTDAASFNVTATARLSRRGEAQTVYPLILAPEIPVSVATTPGAIVAKIVEGASSDTYSITYVDAGGVPRAAATVTGIKPGSVTFTVGYDAATRDLTLGVVAQGASRSTTYRLAPNAPPFDLSTVSVGSEGSESGADRRPALAIIEEIRFRWP